MIGKIYKIGDAVETDDGRFGRIVSVKDDKYMIKNDYNEKEYTSDKFKAIGKEREESLDVESLIDEQMKKMEEYYPKSGDRVEATFVGSNPEYKGKHFTDKVVSIGNDSLVSYTTVTFEKEGQIKDGGNWNFVKV